MRRTPAAVSLLVFAALLLAGCDAQSTDGFDPAAPGLQSEPRADVERRTAATSCPCFSVRDLVRPIDASSPEPYLFFDTFNWWGLDYRRTELRTLTAVDGAQIEEIASIYITPGTSAAHFALICHRQDARPDPYGDGVEYVYTTIEPDLEEAESCRQAIYAAAKELECQGPACGLVYDKAQLYPDYPAYNDGNKQLRLHTQLTATIEAVQAMVLRAD